MTVQQPLIPCTVGILTFNSAGVVERALDATEGFAERVICDGGSTDGTVTIARTRGCMVIRQQRESQRDDGSLRDFSTAVNQMIDVSTQPWFFKLDSDEVPSPDLVAEIREAVSASDCSDAFSVQLRYVVNGKMIEAASTYPMRQVRVIRTASGLRYGGAIHESVDVTGVDVGELSAPLLLPQWPVVATLIPRWWRYLRVELEAQRLGTIGERWARGGRRHARAVRYLAVRTLAVRREAHPSRMPLRYELARIGNHAVACFLIMCPRVGIQRCRRSWRRRS